MANEHFSQSKEDDWGTPPEIVEAARAFMGGIDLDPASSPDRNRTVKASRVLGLPDVNPLVGIPTDWGDAKRIFINPPGGKFGKTALVSLFWAKLAAYVENNSDMQFTWVAYNINQLQTLQVAEAQLLSKCALCIPSRRVRYLNAAGQPQSGTPSASAILGFGDTLGFALSFSQFGAVWLL